MPAQFCLPSIALKPNSSKERVLTAKSQIELFVLPSFLLLLSPLLMCLPESQVRIHHSAPTPMPLHVPTNPSCPSFLSRGTDFLTASEGPASHSVCPHTHPSRQEAYPGYSSSSLASAFYRLQKPSPNSSAPLLRSLEDKKADTRQLP